MASAQDKAFKFKSMGRFCHLLCLRAWLQVNKFNFARLQSSRCRLRLCSHKPRLRRQCSHNHSCTMSQCQLEWPPGSDFK